MKDRNKTDRTFNAFSPVGVQGEEGSIRQLISLLGIAKKQCTKVI